MNQGTIPHLLKSAKIVPIHKWGSKGLPKQYRPVALTSHLTKVFVKVIRKYLVSYLEENNLLNKNKHSFRGSRTGLSQLLTYFDRIMKHPKGKNVDVLYLDFLITTQK